MLPISWDPNYFDSKKGEINERYKGDPDFQEYLTILNLEKAKYWKAVKHHLLKDRPFTIHDVLNMLKVGDKSRLLLSWMSYKSKVRYKDKEIKFETYKKHKSCAIQTAQYIPNDISLLQVDTRWLNNYMAWCLKRMEYSTAWTRIKDIKTYIKIAKKEGVSINEDIRNHHLAAPIHEPTYLTKEELDLLFDLYNSGSLERANFNCLRSFLFACFTGLRISDLKRFDTNFIIDEEIVFTPKKRRLTDLKQHVVKVPLIPIAKTFLENMKEDKLFTTSEQKYNARLKKIAQIAGFNKNLTSHVARHTFASQLAVHGVPVTVIASLLGHRTTKSTMMYIHIAEQIKKKEMFKLQETFQQAKLRISY